MWAINSKKINVLHVLDTKCYWGWREGTAQLAVVFKKQKWIVKEEEQVFKIPWWHWQQYLMSTGNNFEGSHVCKLALTHYNSLSQSYTHQEPPNWRKPSAPWRKPALASILEYRFLFSTFSMIHHISTTTITPTISFTFFGISTGKGLGSHSSHCPIHIAPSRNTL